MINPCLQNPHLCLSFVNDDYSASDCARVLSDQERHADMLHEAKTKLQNAYTYMSTKLRDEGERPADVFMRCGSVWVDIPVLVQDQPILRYYFRRHQLSLLIGGERVQFRLVADAGSSSTTIVRTIDDTTASTTPVLTTGLSALPTVKMMPVAVDSMFQSGESQTPNGESSTPHVIIAVLATLLLLVAVVGIMFFVKKMRGKKKSEHRNTIIGDGNVYNLEPSAHSCIPVTDESKEEFEKHAHVDNEDAAAASTNSKLTCESGIGNEELHTCEVVKDDGYTV